MDDMFGMLYSDLKPERKLLTAVTSNLIDSLKCLLATGVDVNAKLQNGNTAMHIVCSRGYLDCLKMLLVGGADADAGNDFGITPMMLALRHGHVGCVRVLLLNASRLCDPRLVWPADQMDGTIIYTWFAYDTDMIHTLLIATPDLQTLGLDIRDELCACKICPAENTKLVKHYFLTGNDLNSGQRDKLNTNANAELKEWIQEYRSEPRSLQSYARLAVRRNINSNVYHGAAILPLPDKVKEYLVFSQED